MKVIVIHLESISMTHLKQFPEIFNKINNLGVSFGIFNQFYSTCTSTIMSFVDIIYNKFGIFEKINAIDDLVDINVSGIKIWDTLGIEYNKHIALFYPQFWNPQECILLKNIFENIEYLDSRKSLKRRIDSLIQSDNCEMIYIYDGSSSLATMKNLYNIENSWIENWKEGFRCLIDTIEHTIESLKRYKKMNNAVIVMYGDHGEDFWTHSFNGGYTHCTEPYSNITNVPLFIYFPGMNSEQINDVFSMRNLNNLICSLVSNSEVFNSYKNVCKMDGYAFSRNMYMKQTEENKPYRKAYSITDGEYLLMQTIAGYELYMNVYDIGNTFNLLNFFSIENNGILSYNLHGLIPVSSHFTYAMNECRRREIEIKFLKLKERLAMEINNLKDNIK